MATDKQKPTYEDLVDLVERLESLVAEQAKRIVELENKLASCQKNSHNSSKPPSSDYTRKPKPSGKNGRKKRGIGAQPGHTKAESKLTPKDANVTVSLHADHYFDNPELNLEPALDLEPHYYYQYELVDCPVELTVYTSYAYRDLNTGNIFYAPFPAAIKAAGILGPKLAAFSACIKGGIHSSITGVQKVLSHLGADIARGTICKKMDKVSQALDESYLELFNSLPEQSRLNIDETGHKDTAFENKGHHKKHWTWAFVAPEFTVFTIWDTRSTDVLRAVLGEDCEATIGADFYSAYRCYMKEANIKIQFCWAHLIRDFLFISESLDKSISNYGKRLLKLIKKIFRLIHQRQEMDDRIFQNKMLKLKTQFLAKARGSCLSGIVHNMVERLNKFGEEYFTFLDDPMVEPTNNLAEQQIRHCVIDRRVTQGTRGLKGQRWSERIWTTLATCTRKGIDSFKFISQSVEAYYQGEPAPSLLYI